MTTLLQKAVAQAQKLSKEQQNQLAETLFAHLAGNANYHLTDEQVAEVRRRMSKKNPRYASKKQMDALWKKCGL
jgi:hypothetical protein